MPIGDAKGFDSLLEHLTGASALTRHLDRVHGRSVHGKERGEIKGGNACCYHCLDDGLATLIGVFGEDHMSGFGANYRALGVPISMISRISIISADEFLLW